MPENNKRIRFSNMVYLGDGLSDVPCMKMVKAYGGKSIAVYDPAQSTDAAKMAKVEELLRKERVDYIYPADYRENSPLETTIKHIIKMMAIEDVLSSESQRQTEEVGKESEE